MSLRNCILPRHFQAADKRKNTSMLTQCFQKIPRKFDPLVHDQHFHCIAMLQECFFSKYVTSSFPLMIICVETDDVRDVAGFFLSNGFLKSMLSISQNWFDLGSVADSLARDIGRASHPGQ